ncbi:MAG: hypothetical protein IKJ51_05360, partial [Clostridia bacterium]|nr:hypothetical protein [Clostridia bacterium]
AMKTKKRAAERMHSLTASFLSFSPDAKHPAGGVSHRQPVARSAGIQLAKTQSFFAKRFLRDGSAGNQFAKFQLLICEKACVLLRSTGTLFARYIL